MTRLMHRSAWTHTEPDAPRHLTGADVEGLAVHYNGPAVPTAAHHGVEEAVAAYLRGVRRYHVDVHGWSDIAYQYAVDAAGRRWQLRGWIRESGANGNQDVNLRFGAVLAVVGQGQHVSDHMVEGLRDAVAHFRRHYPHAGRIVGHQDVRPDPTACPGKQLEHLVRTGGLEPERAPAPAVTPRRHLAPDRSRHVPRFPGRAAFRLGHRDPAVRQLGRQLRRLGFVAHNDGDGYQPGPTFTHYDRRNVRDFQRAVPVLAVDPDGYPGPITWRKLHRLVWRDG